MAQPINFLTPTRRKRNKQVTLNPARPNAGTQALYRRKLMEMFRPMYDETVETVRRAYEHNEPEMAADSTPANVLQQAVRRMVLRWQKRWDLGAPELAKWFAQSVVDRTDASLQASLRKAGMSVRFQMTPQVTDIAAATVHQNVQLIKSIPQEFLGEVEGLVMRSVQTGRDLHQLTQDLQARYGITERRATIIARDQNNKATSAIVNARQRQLGITEAIWLHSKGRKHPRKKHLAAHGERYDVTKGLPVGDKGQYVFPGEEINCFPGDSRLHFADGVSKAYRRWYSGHLTEVVTDTGKTLRATPNHPVLTPNGWRPIGLLQEGDDVMEVSIQRVFGPVREMHEHHAITTLAECFDALARSGRRTNLPILARDFHGDGSPDSDVDIVNGARPLTIGIQPDALERFAKHYFTVSNNAASRLCALAKFGARALLSAYRSMCRGSTALSPLWSFAGHLNARGLAWAADGATGGLDPIDDGLAINSMFLGKREDASTLLMGLAQRATISRVKTTPYEGHVYNLQTKSGWYVTEGIITHNCGCVCKSIVPGFS